MRRRRFIGAVALGLGAGIAGCSGRRADSDGDGVVDGEDYAPRDPAVQARADLRTTATTVRANAASVATGARGETRVPPDAGDTVTPASGASPLSADGATPPAGSAAESPGAGAVLSADPDFWAGHSHVARYGLDAVEVHVQDAAALGDVSALEVVDVLYSFPRATGLAIGRSDPIAPESLPRTVPVELDLDPAALPAGERLHHLAVAVPAGSERRAWSRQGTVTLGESAPFTVDAGTGRIERAPHPAEPGSESARGYERTRREGVYVIDTEGRTAGVDWRTQVYVFRSAYVRAAERSRGRSRPEYVTWELTDGLAGDLAAVLDRTARDYGFTSPRERAAFVIDYVQRLPYVPDDVGTGYDEYTKFVAETLVEGGGDCEDTSILLAATLQADPLGFDTILVQPPGHMAVGIYGSDQPGYYWEVDGRRYYYVETTGPGWDVGDLPADYRGERAVTHQV